MSKTADHTIEIRDHRRPGHYTVDTIFIKGGWAAVLGPYGISVYDAIACFASNDTQSAFPKYETIAEAIGCSRRQVDRAVADLEGGGLITITPRRRKNGTKTSNLFTLIDCSQWLPPEAILANRQAMAKKAAAKAAARVMAKTGQTQTEEGLKQTDSESVCGNGHQTDSESVNQTDSESLHELTPLESVTNPTPPAPGEGGNDDQVNLPPVSLLNQGTNGKNLTTGDGERINAVISQFTSLTKIKPGEADFGRWSQGAKGLLADFGADTEGLMREAWKLAASKVKAGQIVIAAPGSLRSFMQQVKAQQLQRTPDPAVIADADQQRQRWEAEAENALPYDQIRELRQQHEAARKADKQ